MTPATAAQAAGAPAAAPPQVTMSGAINRALRDAMTADADVVVFGEDVSTLGGVFRVTDGLARDFGEDRCFDTPLAESGIVGFAVGMAMAGFRAAWLPCGTARCGNAVRLRQNWCYRRAHE